MTDKERFIQLWEREYPTTLKVLKAFPSDQKDFKPHERSMTALKLAAVIVGEERAFVEGALKGELTFEGMPDPGNMEEIIALYEDLHPKHVAKVRAMSDEDFASPIMFFTGPKQMAPIPKGDLLEFIVLDNIHHRGQMSVYIRMAGGKVPGIYGPSADEPWQ